MKRTRALLWVVGVVQLVLGLGYSLAPQALLHWMGHSPISNDIAYPLGMLASRFLVYGVLLMVAARNPAEHRMLMLGMVWIQVLDLAAGLYFTAAGVVGIALSGFPMFNAAVIALLMWLWMPAAAMASGRAR